MPKKPSARPQSLQVSDFTKYLTTPALLWCYQQINKAGSRESDVDRFYLHFLPEIFTLKDNFIVQEECPVAKIEGHAGRTDFTVRCVKIGSPKKVIICENKRRDKESRTAVWARALNQVVGYATGVSQEAGQENQTLYITVNVGTYLRFYEFPPSMQVKDWAPAGGRLFELADDEEELWELWHKLRDLTISP